MKLLRTLSTRRLLVLLASVAIVAAGGAAIAVAASGGTGAMPSAKPLAQALQDALSAPKPQGITADVTFTNTLFPSGSLLGSAGSALMSGATGRLWVANDGRGRLELKSDASGDVQIVWNASEVTVYDASSNTVYQAALPAHASSAPSDSSAPPALSEISSFLSGLSSHADVSGAQPDNVAGQPAYTVTVSPKHDAGLLGSVQLAWDAARGVPLRLAVYAHGSSAPVLELRATNISYGPVSESDVAVAPPQGAKVVDLSGAGSTSDSSGSDQAPVTGLAAVQAAAGFTVTAPDTLVGLPRQDVRLVGGKGALATYGQGLGAIVVFERKADVAAGHAGALASVPTVSLDGATAHELATQLGTVIEWQRGGVDYVLAGSLPPGAAESAARALR